MICPEPDCKGRAKCTDTRPHEHGTRRRYRCKVCDTRFSTMEVLSHTGDSNGRNPLQLQAHALQVEALDEIETELATLLGVLRRRYKIHEADA